VLQEKSREVFDALAEALYGKTLLVSVGGIDSGEEAWRRIRAGASLIQVYTGLIFKGPGLVRDINQDLVARMRAEGIEELSDAVGADR
jgi:dihydroorotate dehydrogenase